MYIDTMEATAFVEVEKPSLKALADLLRHPERWPEGFEWNFKVYETCALGLCHQYWGISNEPLQGLLDISYEVSNDIFCTSWFNIGPMSWVTPKTVARRIERYLRWGI